MKDKIGKVDEVQVVGNVSNRTLDSLNMIGIWEDREGMIKAVWDNYKKKELEHVVESNRKTRQDSDSHENWENGFISDAELEKELENGAETINWIETYTFFPCLHDLPNEDPELFFKEIEEPYNYNASFVFEHFTERKLIFNHLEMGLGTWDMVVEKSLATFEPYSKEATKLLEKIRDLHKNREF